MCISPIYYGGCRTTIFSPFSLLTNRFLPSTSIHLNQRIYSTSPRLKMSRNGSVVSSASISSTSSSQQTFYDFSPTDSTSHSSISSFMYLTNATTTSRKRPSSSPIAISKQSRLTSKHSVEMRSNTPTHRPRNNLQIPLVEL